jgi:hypothetical protein
MPFGDGTSGRCAVKEDRERESGRVLGGISSSPILQDTSRAVAIISIYYFTKYI